MFRYTHTQAATHRTPSRSQQQQRQSTHPGPQPRGKPLPLSTTQALCAISRCISYCSPSNQNQTTQGKTRSKNNTWMKDAAALAFVGCRQKQRGEIKSRRAIRKTVARLQKILLAGSAPRGKPKGLRATNEIHNLTYSAEEVLCDFVRSVFVNSPWHSSREKVLLGSSWHFRSFCARSFPVFS